MKKTKFITCLAALALLLAGCNFDETTSDSSSSTSEGGSTSSSTDTGSGNTSEGDGGTSSSDTGSGTEGEGTSRLGLLGEAFKLVGAGNYTLTCYSTAVATDDQVSYKGIVTQTGILSTSYTGTTTGMINDPDDGGFVEVTLDGDLLKASAASDTSRTIQDYMISSDIDTALFEELEDGRFALKDEGFTSDVLQDLFPDRPFTGGLITPVQGTIYIDVEDDLSNVTYYYDSNINGTFTVTLVVENLGTTVFPYDLSTQYVKYGSEEVTSWATFLDSSLKASVDELLGADLDDVLPFFVPDGGYSYTGIWSGKFNLSYSGDASVWVSPLLEFGYTEVTANSEYVLEGEIVNYTVTLSSFFGNTDLYLGPTEKPSEPVGPTTWAEFINNSYDLGVLYDTLGANIDDVLPFYYEETGYSGYYAVSGVRFYLAYYYPSSTLTDGWLTALTEFGYTLNSSVSNNYGGTTYTLTYNGYEVEIITSSFGEWTLNLYPPVAEPVGPTSWAEYFTDKESQEALKNLFGDVALDDILPFYLEESGLQTCVPQPEYLRFKIEYHPEPEGLTETWVALLLADGWTETSDESSNNGTTETLSFEKDGYTISIVIEWGWWDLYLYPRTTTGGGAEEDEDLQTAQAILDVVTSTSYLDWDAYHGESIDDWEETISEYLTTDEDGNAYGYVVSSEDSTTSYYYRGYKCNYNQAGVAQTPGESYLDYENELDDYSEPLLSAHYIDLSDVDSYEINELDDGYELVITNGASSNIYGYGTEYVYIVDGQLNLTAVGQYGPMNVASSDLVGSYAEKITYADVEAALAATPFDPADFGLVESEEPTSHSSVADLLSDISSNCNYTLTLEYKDLISDNYDSEDECLAGYPDEELELWDCIITISYTQDAVLIEYYENDDDYVGMYDVEMYVNDYENNQMLYYESDEGDELEQNSRYTETGRWQDNLPYLADLADYTDAIIEGDGDDEIAYTFDFSDDFYEDLIDSLLIGGNYWPDYNTDGPDNLSDLIENEDNFTYESTYTISEDTWYTHFDTGFQIYSYRSQYYAEQDQIFATVSNVGSTTISSQYTLTD